MKTVIGTINVSSADENEKYADDGDSSEQHSHEFIGTTIVVIIPIIRTLNITRNTITNGSTNGCEHEGFSITESTLGGGEGVSKATRKGSLQRSTWACLQKTGPKF